MTILVLRSPTDLRYTEVMGDIDNDILKKLRIREGWTGEDWDHIMNLNRPKKDIITVGLMVQEVLTICSKDFGFSLSASTIYMSEPEDDQFIIYFLQKPSIEKNDDEPGQRTEKEKATRQSDSEFEEESGDETVTPVEDKTKAELHEPEKKTTDISEGSDDKGMNKEQKPTNLKSILKQSTKNWEPADEPSSNDSKIQKVKTGLRTVRTKLNKMNRKPKTSEKNVLKTAFTFRNRGEMESDSSEFETGAKQGYMKQAEDIPKKRRVSPVGYYHTGGTWEEDSFLSSDDYDLDETVISEINEKDNRKGVRDERYKLKNIVYDDAQSCSTTCICQEVGYDDPGPSTRNVLETYMEIPSRKESEDSEEDPSTSIDEYRPSQSKSLIRSFTETIGNITVKFRNYVRRTKTQSSGEVERPPSPLYTHSSTGRYSGYESKTSFDSSFFVTSETGGKDSEVKNK